jgi:hypothetical protein
MKPAVIGPAFSFFLFRPFYISPGSGGHPRARTAAVDWF